MKEQYELEFVLPVSPKLLYQLISTEEGLSKWFADRVNIQKDNLTFVWSKENYEAKILAQKECKFFKYAWLEDIESNNNYFVEFSISSNQNDNSTILKITDFTDPHERNENIMLWNSNIDQLKRAMGING
ncbi:MAG TPA: START-like domain-containing protein [Bacteroidales bacterium]|nr:START-like domain-containing protein [Bacteroidales bacterium]